MNMITITTKHINSLNLGVVARNEVLNSIIEDITIVGGRYTKSINGATFEVNVPDDVTDLAYLYAKYNQFKGA